MHARMRDLDSQFDEITINGKTLEKKGMTISYDEIIDIAFPNSKNVNYSVIVEASRSNWKKARILLPDQTVEKFDGMKIKVSYTGNS